VSEQARPTAPTTKVPDLSVVHEVDAPRLTGRRVLVVGINYAPEHTGIAPYTTQACEHFVKQGADVLVLSGVPHYPQWCVPDEYRWRRKVVEDHAGVQVRRLRHYVPSSQSAVRRGLYEATFGVHALAERLPQRPDVVVAVVPSLLGAHAAARIAKREGVPLVVWVQDLMGPAVAQSGIAGGGGRVSAATTRMEHALLKQADRVFVLNEAFHAYVADAGVPVERIQILPNWTHVRAPAADRATTRQRLGWRPDEVIALHSGNMGLKQGLDNVVAAAQLAQRTGSCVRFVLMGDGNQRAVLEELGHGVANLQFLPPADSADFPDVLAAADVLLVNERATAVDMSLPSKLTSYFAAGMPVIAAVPGLGGTAQEVRRSGAGRLVTPEDAAALLDGVLELAADDDLLQVLRLAASAHAHERLASAPSLALLAETVADISVA